MAETLLFGLALDGLEGRHRRRFPDDFLGMDGLHEGVTHLVGVGQDVVFRIACEGITDGGVGSCGDAGSGELALGVGRQLAVVDEERGRLGGNEQVAHEDGVAWYVAAPQVECPGDVVEPCHEHAVSVLAAQGFAYALEFGGSVFASVGYGLWCDGLHGHGRAVSPDALQDV